MATHVMLVPGFFGFTSLGQVGYFRHVERQLGLALTETGRAATLHRLDVGPTASLARRAARVGHQILGKTDPTDDVVIVGHSTGGLDARVLLTPGVRLPGLDEPDLVAQRVRAVVTVCTPHYGTPVADYFTTLPGQTALKALSLGTIALLRLGPLPPKVLGSLAQLLSGKQSLIDHVHRELLSGLDEAQAEEVRAFMRQIRDDTTLLQQLRPAAVELLKMTLRTPEHVALGSVAAAAPPPRLATFARQGLSPANQASHLVFGSLRRMAGDLDARYQAALPGAARERLQDLDDVLSTPGASDGMVPTVSQVHGELITGAVADHLDVLGHFEDRSLDPPHYDWMVSGSHFRQPDFQRMWREVARWIDGAL
jgi:pimeloyl-ACP methyl ester carboxylesterase